MRVQGEMSTASGDSIGWKGVREIQARASAPGEVLSRGPLPPVRLMRMRLKRSLGSIAWNKRLIPEFQSIFEGFG